MKKIIMKNLFIAITLALILTSCQNHETNKGFQINGTIVGEVPEKIYLEYDNKVDTALVQENKFYFSGESTKFSEAAIKVPGLSAFANEWIYLENEEIDLKLNIANKKSGQHEYKLISVDTISGTKTSIIRSEFQKFLKTIKNKKNKDELLYNKIEEIVETNPENNYSSYLLSKYSKEFTQKETQSLLDKIDTTAIAANRLEDIKRILNPERILKVGDKIADFSLPDVNGQMVNTKDFRNKIVLIDFWASWCGPCRKKHPKLKRIYDDYKNDGFEIIGVSTDTNINHWKKAIVKDSIDWINLNENKNYNGKVASRYNIRALPTTYLIDNDGVIISKNITLEELKDYLSNS
ncbi:AhpC/TSA family protein [Gramella lutea]|uniref:AhpC/TSA family protein n=1 Tax=Christiangramia lutea TaxID=1607951 RepID=A0A9X1V919_9FLAO|nr:TlpA disulfide reductase family protein [Christiangramia lutea]MCH4824603.1 AhpC/TSA family protein [Christiangramia lutea]